MIKKISDKLRNYKGVTLITLIIAITIFAIFITVFSYVMVAKHGSSALYVQSTQAYAVAQAGIEYGIRCAQDSSCWDYTTTATLEKNFGDGSFTLDYDEPNNTLISTGMVGVATRKIILSSFSGSSLSSYVEAAVGWFTTVPGNPPVQGSGGGGESKKVYVPLTNNYDAPLYIYKIELAKTGSPSTLRSIEFGSTEVWSGSQGVSTDSGNPADFSFNQVSYYPMAPGSGSDNTLILIAGSSQDLDETWYCTFWYSEQSDLSDPQSSSVPPFTIP